MIPVERQELDQRETTPLDTSVDELNANFIESIARLKRRLRAERAGDEFNDLHRSVLTLLVSEGPRTLSQLSDHEHVKPPSMSETVNVLEQSGLVERTSDPQDGSKVILVATPHGEHFVAQSRRRRHEWLNQRLHELTGEERRTLAAAAAIISRITDS